MLGFAQFGALSGVLQLIYVPSFWFISYSSESSLSEYFELLYAIVSVFKFLSSDAAAPDAGLGSSLYSSLA